MLQVDLRTHIIAKSVRCWRLFPGSGYKFLQDFIDGGLAFLDVPGFELPEGRLSTAKDIAKRIRKSEIILEKISKDGRDDEHRVSDKEIGSFRVGKRRQRNQQALINFFEQAELGDVVIIPEPLYQGRVHVGIFTSKSLDAVYTTSPKSYGPNRIPARRIKWVKSIEENKLSSDLAKSLRHQHPFSLIERSHFLELFSLAFDSYVYGERFSSVIFNKKDDYTDRETALIGLVSTLAANFTESVEEGHIKFPDFSSSLIAPASIEFHCSQASDIHSPGFNRFIGSKPTALVIAALIAVLGGLAMCATKAEMEQELPKIVYVNNSTQAAEDCTAFVSTTVDRILKAADSDTLWIMCQAMKDAEARAGLESSAKADRLR